MKEHKPRLTGNCEKKDKEGLTMSCSTSYFTPGIADVALRVAKMFYPRNRDPALEFEDFVQEITIHLARKLSGVPCDEALMYRIATNKAIDLIRRGKYRAHASLNEPIQTKEGDCIERGEYLERHNPVLREGSRDHILDQLSLRELIASLPENIIAIIMKKIYGYRMSDAERKRLSRFRRKRRHIL